MKYTIELTNKQKAQMDCIMEIVHRYVGFNPKLEPIKATNVEDTNEYQIGYKEGYADGKADAIYNTDLLDELKQVEYIRGLEDAKTYIVKLYSYGMVEMENEFDETTIPDIITNNPMTDIIATIDAYEEKKKADEIKVGDIVKFNEKCHSYTTNKDREYLVLHKFDNGIATLLYDNGDTGAADIILIEKTGRHFDEVEQLLDKLKGKTDEKN